jgi:5-methylcytosine-specific restriction endonuclease McrA
MKKKSYSKRIQSELGCHLYLLNKIDAEGDKWVCMMDPGTVRLVLCFAGYKCERCGSFDNLTVHHLIPREASKYMHPKKYLKQRNYFGNQILLCVDCHNRIEGFAKGSKMKSISKSKINRLKSTHGYVTWMKGEEDV